MTKPFTCISSIRKATGSIYSPFALVCGSRASKGSEGGFGLKKLSVPVLSVVWITQGCEQPWCWHSHGARTAVVVAQPRG